MINGRRSPVRVAVEELHLSKVFGDAYARYCSDVGRWLTISKHRGET
jgi:protein-S-isoprenylcysteine O-methyltransferase Ste14